jgi:hypothetical protein
MLLNFNPSLTSEGLRPGTDITSSQDRVKHERGRPSSGNSSYSPSSAFSAFSSSDTDLEDSRRYRSSSKHNRRSRSRSRSRETTSRSTRSSTRHEKGKRKETHVVIGRRLSIIVGLVLVHGAEKLEVGAGVLPRDTRKANGRKEIGIRNGPPRERDAKSASRARRTKTGRKEGAYLLVRRCVCFSRALSLFAF